LGTQTTELESALDIFDHQDQSLILRSLVV